MKDSQEVVELLKKLMKYVTPKLGIFPIAVNKEKYESLIILRGKLYEMKRTNAKKGIPAETIWEKVRAGEIINAIKKYGITGKKLSDHFKTVDKLKRLTDEIEKDPEFQKELKNPDG